ncbi:MAG: RNA 2',3'-cyclic phosphodiesterase [Tenericutes bacterium]|jgi:2'-5' RNA ligase|nr:RNA 2',3'-cyclic phosphodiesterase [Mycoplasmatota bacterium]
MRIFIAILFSPAINHEIYDIIETIKEKNYHGQSTVHDNLHLTLHYIGETKQEKLSEIIKQLKEIIINSFSIQTKNIDYFGKEKKKKILYLGIENNHELKKLHNEVVKQLNNIGYMIDEETYIPHITLMRRVKVEDDAFDNFEFKSLKIAVEGISVMESKRIDNQLVYEEIEHIDLKK